MDIVYNNLQFHNKSFISTIRLLVSNKKTSIKFISVLKHLYILIHEYYINLISIFILQCIINIYLLNIKCYYIVSSYKINNSLCSLINNILINNTLFISVNSIYITVLYKVYVFNNINSFIKYYNYSLYLRFCEVLLIFSKQVDIFALPVNKSKYTVLKSPHTDKKSREQFELLRRTYNISIYRHALFINELFNNYNGLLVSTDILEYYTNIS